MLIASEPTSLSFLYNNTQTQLYSLQLHTRLSSFFHLLFGSMPDVGAPEQGSIKLIAPRFRRELNFRLQTLFVSSLMKLNLQSVAEFLSSFIMNYKRPEQHSKWRNSINISRWFAGTLHHYHIQIASNVKARSEKPSP